MAGDGESVCEDLAEALFKPGGATGIGSQRFNAIGIAELWTGIEDGGIADDAPQRIVPDCVAIGVHLIDVCFVRSPELMPLEDLWRGLKQTVAANRCYPSLEELARRAVAWLEAMTPTDRLARCGFAASKFDWLPT
jgi:hypothetical protein